MRASSNTDYLSGKRKLFAIFFSLCVLLSVSASATFVNQWGEYGDDVSARNWIADDNGLWNQSYQYYSYSLDGGRFQPLAVDLDSDAVSEILIQDDNFLQVYHFSLQNGLILMDEINTVDSAVGQISAIFYNESDHPFIVGAYENDLGTSDEIRVFRYDSGTITLVQNRTIGTGFSVRTGLRCMNYSGTVACFFAGDDGVNSSIVIYSITTNGYTIYDISGLPDVFQLDNDGEWRRQRNVPLIWDVDKDQNFEVVFISDMDGDGDEGFIIWDIDQTQIDCYEDDMSVNTNPAYVSGITVSNTNSVIEQYEDCLQTCADRFNLGWLTSAQAYICTATCNFYLWSSTWGGGASDLLVSYSLDEIAPTVTSHSYLATYDSTCTESLKVTSVGDPSTSHTTYVSNVLFQDFVYDDDWEYCIIGQDYQATGGTDETVIRCFDKLTLNPIFEWGTGFGAGLNELFINRWSTIIGANMDEDAKMEIVVGGAIINLNDDNTISYINTTITAPSFARFIFPIVADVTGDRNVEIIGQSFNTMYVSASTYVNQPPSINRFRRSIANPICVENGIGTPLKIWADEGLGDYSNDGAEDNERLLVEFPNGTTFISDLHLTQPSVTFQWNQTGSFDIKVYLQDEFNPDILEDYVDTVTLVFSSNQAICNEDEGKIILSGDTSTDEEEAQNEIDDLLSGFGLELSSLAKLIFWLIFMVIMTIIVLNNLPEVLKAQGLVTVFVIFLLNIVMLIAGNVFGFIPMWVIFLIVFVITGVAVISMFRGSGAGS